MTNVKSGDSLPVTLNFLGMALVNFVTYTVIPFFIQRSGATLLNLSNVTTIIWSMLADIFLYGSNFYPLCLLAFAIEMCGIVIFSSVKPIPPSDNTEEEDLTDLPNLINTSESNCS